MTVKQRLRLATVCYLAYAALSMTLYVIKPSRFYWFMVWNLFLAFIPLLFITLALRWWRNGKRVRAVLFGALWLLFFPNTPYLITDFINTMDYFAYYETTRIFLPWLRLMHTGIGVVFGIVVGMYSLYIVHTTILKRFGKLLGHSALVVICLLSGYAISIGRFLRVNSWDVLNPFSLIPTLWRNFNGFTVQYSLLMAATTLFLYAVCALAYTMKQND